MNYLVKIFILGSLLYWVPSASAQVESIRYALVYNSHTQWYDCLIYIEKGEALSVRDRVQMNAQFSVVVPTGADVSIARTYQPLLDNHDLTGTKPADWNITSKLVAPANTKDLDFYGITPSLAPVAFYNPLPQGSYVRLFSLDIKGEGIHKDKIRIFDNKNDPKSNVSGMFSADFSNGFTMGGLHQKYNGIKLTRPDELQTSLFEENEYKDKENIKENKKK